ncbi:MAG TPA: PKD domain-containing protein [Thermoleophilaceae bacterium]
MRRGRALVTSGLLVCCLGGVDTAAAGTLAFVAGTAPAPNNRVAVVDTATGAIVNTFPEGASFFGAITLSRDGTRGWLSDQAGIKLFDTRTQAILGPIAGPATSGLATSPDGTRVYAVDSANDTLVVLDANTGGVITAVPTDNQPEAVAVNTAGTRAYVPARGVNAVTVVDLTNNTKLTTIPGGGHLDRPESVAVTPDGSKVYVPNFGSSAGGTTVTVINAATNTIAGDISGFLSPAAATPSPNGRYMYIADRDHKRVAVIDVATDTHLAAINLPNFVSDVAITPAGDKLVTVDFSQGHITVVDLVTRQMVAPPVAFAGSRVAIEPVQTPVATINATAAPAGQDTQLDGSGSSAAFGAVRSFAWSFGDGAQGTGATISHAFASASTYDVSLTVTNDCASDAVFGPVGLAFGGITTFCNGPRTATATKQVEVPAPPAAPAPIATGPTAATGGSTIEFRRKPRIKRLTRGRFRMDTGIDVICGASATGCGGSQATAATLPRKPARSTRLLLVKKSFPARANTRTKLVFTLTGRTAHRLARYKRLRFTTTVATHDRTGKAVRNVRKYALRIPR